MDYLSHVFYNFGTIFAWIAFAVFIASFLGALIMYLQARKESTREEQQQRIYYGNLFSLGGIIALIVVILCVIWT